MSSAPSATARRPGADAAAQKNKVPSKTTIKAGKKGSTSREKAGKGQREEENEYDSLEYIAPLPEEDEKACQPPQKISTKLVARRAFGEEALAGLTGDEIADRVLVLQHVRLDDERVEEIDNLEMLGVGVSHLYLQRNLISTIENLESMRNLQLLCLASNSITVLENLLCLASLKALDVGYNLIQKVQPGQVPASVLYLTTDGNPLEEMGEGEWKEVFEDLPLLRTHDCVDVDRGDGSEGED
uniref:Dynein assembly factor 1, axonemal homolog n=1 Tax=Hemiselmis andersenii TaxID=464988 RepID=A0A7S0TEQ0_HEMAN|mmetsp:Transcript_10816/g.25192  ORF Transcript_10816/g.25192 Transcript_10816/m.25192 type:complete len:242 (+) Transcript_10816:198-923(+)